MSSIPTSFKDVHAKSKSSNNKILVRNKRNVILEEQDDSRSRDPCGLTRQTSQEEPAGGKSQIRVKRRLGAGVRRASSILEQASIPDEEEEEEDADKVQETLTWAEIRRRRKVSAPSIRSTELVHRPDLRKCESVCLPDSTPAAGSAAAPCESRPEHKSEPADAAQAKDSGDEAEASSTKSNDNNNNVEHLSRVSSTDDEQHISETSTSSSSSTSTATEICDSDSGDEVPESSLQQDIDIEAIRQIEVNEQKDEERIILCVKREISELSIDECLARLNQKISSLKNDLKD
jgi:hypothetical protein